MNYYRQCQKGCLKQIHRFMFQVRRRRVVGLFKPELILHKSQLKISYHDRQPIRYQRRFGSIVVKTDRLIQAVECEPPASAKSADESHLARAGCRSCLERKISKVGGIKVSFQEGHSGESRYFVNFSSSV